MTTVQPAPLTGAEIAEMRRRANATKIWPTSRESEGNLASAMCEQARETIRALDELERTREALREIATLKDTPAGQACCAADPELMIQTIIDRARSVLPAEASAKVGLPPDEGR